ncbi:MAG: neutral zinc metallopeptidase [Pseudonocardia sp.]
MRRTTWVACLLAVLFVAWPSPVPPAAAAASPAPQACTTLEGCYSYGEMREFYEQVLGLIDSFSQASFLTMPRPRYGYVASGQAVPIACGGVADGTAFFYCPIDDTLYIGQDQLWEFYEGTGDGGAAFGVAHEWGHYVQDRSGVLRRIAADDQIGRIRSENQADCVGGAFLGYARDRGILEADDYDDVNTILPLIASAESDVFRDHGTVQERAQAVRYGFDRGLSACSDYFPATPLVA